MRTFKKCAVSHDNPDYLIRNKFIILHKNAKVYFPSEQRAAYPITMPRPLKTINVEQKFGMSRDTPCATQYSPINMRTPALFEPSSIRANHAPRRLMLTSSHASIKECLRKAKGDTETFTKMVQRTYSAEQLSMKRPVSLSLTTLRISQEDMIKNSLPTVQSMQRLRQIMKQNGSQLPPTYVKRLDHYFASMSRKPLAASTPQTAQTARSANTVRTAPQTKGNGYALLLTEPPVRPTPRKK